MIHTIEAMVVISSWITSSILGGRWYPSNFLVRTYLLGQDVRTTPAGSSIQRSVDSSSTRDLPQLSEVGKVRSQSSMARDSKAPEPEFEWANYEQGVPRMTPASVLVDM